MNSTTTCFYYVAYINADNESGTRTVEPVILVIKNEGAARGRIATSTDNFQTVGPRGIDSQFTTPYKSICTTVADSSGGGSSVASTSTLPALGSINFGIGILVVIASFMFISVVWNIISPRNRYK